MLFTLILSTAIRPAFPASLALGGSVVCGAGGAATWMGAPYAAARAAAERSVRLAEFCRWTTPSLN
jgi:hypothetical protein